MDFYFTGLEWGRHIGVIQYLPQELWDATRRTLQWQELFFFQKAGVVKSALIAGLMK